MDYKRIALYFFLFGLILLLWTNWQEENQERQAQLQEEVEIVQEGDFIPGTSEHAATETEVIQGVDQPIQVEAEQVAASTDLVQVTTDVLNITIDLQGGNVISSKLLEYYEEVDAVDRPFLLLNDEPKTRYVAQSGLIQEGRSGEVGEYTAVDDAFILGPEDDYLEVVLERTDRPGVNIKKIYRFQRGSYAIDLHYQVENQTLEPWEGNFYTQLVRIEPKSSKAGLFVLSSYIGASYSNPDKKLYQKLSFGAMRKSNLDAVIDDGWAAMQEHYFLSAWIPQTDQSNRYYSRYNSNRNEYTIGMVGPKFTVAANEELQVEAKLYTGPEIAEYLEPLAPGLELTIDYGWLWFISIFLFWVMKIVYDFVGNWGWSIVIVTLLIKLAFYHLSATSYRSMANMRKLAPRIQSLKERFGNDRAKMSQAMMELYKKEKVNPLGGCLPILIQIPVFIALYWVLIESVELRHAPFIGWIHDLSAKDPYYILPVLMGVSMFMMQKLSPPPPDPMMAKMMMFMPVLFTFIFIQFPAGLVLYWLANNVLSILQQWYITRKVLNAPAKKK